MLLPLMLCAGVGSVAVNDEIVLLMVEAGSIELGEFCDGLCGVWGWSEDMMSRSRRSLCRSMAPVD